MFAQTTTRRPIGARAPVKKPTIEPGHELGNCKGTNIDMKCYDHAVAGAINGGVAFAFFDESAGQAELHMRKYGEKIEAVFKKGEDGKRGGTIKSGEGETARETTVQFAGLDAENKKIKYLLNGKETVVSMKAEGAGEDPGHFRNPTFATEVDGKPVKFKMDVESCYGYIISMCMTLLGAYAH